MADDEGARVKEKGKSQFEQRAGENVSLVREMLGFLDQSKKWWLLPILGTLLIVGVFVLLSTTVAAPFVYTFF